MKTKIVTKYWRLAVIILLLLTTFAASTAQADEPLPGNIITAGTYHSCALKPDGSVACWGSNDYSQAEDQPGPYTQISARGYYSCALTPSGVVDCWGHNFAGQAEDQPGPYIQVSTGHAHTCALTPAGAVDCWGDNYYGQAQDHPGPYIQLNTNTLHTCALTPSGTVDCWGWNEYGQAEDHPGPYNHVSAGFNHTCALTPAGAVDCWGDNYYGQAQDHPGPYTQLSTGYGHTCALTLSGAVDCWGWNLLGQAEDQPGTYGPYDRVVDTTPPVVTVTGVTEGSTYILGAIPPASCSTTDEGSGVAVEASLSLSVGNQLGVGTFTATCSGALDNAGNPGNTAVVNYSVAFQFTGFSAPVDNPAIINIARPGQVIPLKWRLTDANGNPALNLTDVTVSATSLSCDAGMIGDTLEEYVASNSGLQNLGDGYYQWNWKTPNNYANSCKTLHLDLGEGAGSEHTALFQFK